MDALIPSIEVKQLKKTYQNLSVLKGLDLQIQQGEFFGLLGPNGAGKTTLIGSIVGLVKPDAGEVRVLGERVSVQNISTRKNIGFAPQEVNVDRFFNIRKTLEFQGGFFGLSRAQAKERAEELLLQFNLISKAKDPFYKLSGGMQRRLLIARALMSKPKILILDEPTAGVDVRQREELWTYLKNLNADGTSILLTTHYIDEAELLCERVAIINQGQIIEQGKPAQLIQKYCKEHLLLLFQNKIDEIDLDEFKLRYDIKYSQNRLELEHSQVGLILPMLLEKMAKNNPVIDLKIRQGSLEEVFVKLTGETL